MEADLSAPKAEDVIVNQMEPEPENTTCESSAKSSLNPKETEIVEHLAQNPRVFFRSQQINDPEISLSERRAIILSVWHKGTSQLLNRFGPHILESHLDYFDQMQNYPVEDEYEIRFHLSELRKRLQNRQQVVKNRRFAAMRQMIDDDDCSYFEEHEMMAREPLLYDHLVGQYMTDTEQKIRDNFDPNAQFSGVLLEGIERDHVKQLQLKQQKEEDETICNIQDDEGSDEDEADSNDARPSSNKNNAHHDGIINEEYYPQTPPSYKKHWGDFDEDSSAATSSANPVASTSSSRGSAVPPTIPKIPSKRPLDDKQSYITLTEKEMLRQEFFGIMQANFLAGKDAEFDYATVDDNTEYDDVEQLNRDAEDRYFDEDDDDDNNGSVVTTERVAQGSCSMSDESSEDELDNYMKNITNEVDK